MQSVSLPRIGFADAWRQQARMLLQEGVPPDALRWQMEGAEATLFGALDSKGTVALAPVANPVVPKSFLPLMEAALCYNGPQRFALPYRVLWRLQNERNILQDRSDRDVAELHEMEKSVRRDHHKMKAFVRFRDIGVSEAGRRQFGAWFEPEHHIVERASSFFMRRFADMDWSIATPLYTARYENGALSVQLSAGRPDLPDDDADDLWRTYFANIFNPARLKIKAMKSEMPVKYWKNLPEARLIPEMIANAEQSARAMQVAMPTLAHPRTDKIVQRLGLQRAEDEDQPLPETVEEARSQAASCTRCDLCTYATQTVFGEGPSDGVMFVGEQPGDIEDLSGRPFTGPAGQLFNAVMAEAGIDRSQVYVTNAVKHFKFEPRGKRRIHMRPNAGEVMHCKWWLDLERVLVRPSLIVAMGATAALSVTGSGDAIMQRRGRIEIADDGTTPVYLTVHPSAVLRAGNPQAMAEARASFLADMQRLAGLLQAASLSVSSNKVGQRSSA